MLESHHSSNVAVRSLQFIHTSTYIHIYIYIYILYPANPCLKIDQTIVLYPKFGYMSNAPKILIHCRTGACLLEKVHLMDGVGTTAVACGQTAMLWVD